MAPGNNGAQSDTKIASHSSPAARVWSDRQLDRVTPPQVNDMRGNAFLSAVNRLLGKRRLPGPDIRDPEACPAEVLPALIAEYSMEEFIEPGLPEHVIRRILKNRWALQSLEGKDAGVRLGLELLGVGVSIEQWYRQEPMGAANTHRITASVREILYPDAGGYFAERQLAAIWRMINRTKRYSQETELRIGVGAEASIYSAAFANVTVLAEALPPEPIPPLSIVAASRAVVPTAHLIASA